MNIFYEKKINIVLFVHNIMTRLMADDTPLITTRLPCPGGVEVFACHCGNTAQK